MYVYAENCIEDGLLKQTANIRQTKQKTAQRKTKREKNKYEPLAHTAHMNREI